MKVTGLRIKTRRDWLINKLMQAYVEARKNKLGTDDEQKFEMKLEENIVKLADDILEGRYHPSPGVAFVVHDPKEREIFAAPFRDRVVHHFLYILSGEFCDRRFIFDSYSCRRGKGTSKGVERMAHITASVSENYKKRTFVVQMDIKGYFMSLPRRRIVRAVYGMLKKQFKDDTNKNYRLRKKPKVPIKNRLAEAGQFFEEFFISDSKTGRVQLFTKWTVRRRSRFNRFPFLLGISMSIYQRRGYIGMPKPLGDQCEIHSCLVQMHGPAVAEKMRMDMLRNLWTDRPCFLPIFFYYVSDSPVG